LKKYNKMLLLNEVQEPEVTSEEEIQVN